MISAPKLNQKTKRKRKNKASVLLPNLPLRAAFKIGCVGFKTARPIPVPARADIRPENLPRTFPLKNQSLLGKYEWRRQQLSFCGWLLAHHLPVHSAVPDECQTGSGWQPSNRKKRRAMFSFIKYTCGSSFWATPGNMIYEEILRSSGWRGQRRSNTLVPTYSIYAGIEDPPPPPQRPIPTDVPVKEPIDVPTRGPRDVPPPPGSEKPVAPPTKEPHDVPPGPQPRSVT